MSTKTYCFHYRCDKWQRGINITIIVSIVLVAVLAGIIMFNLPDSGGTPFGDPGTGIVRLSGMLDANTFWPLMGATVFVICPLWIVSTLKVCRMQAKRFLEQVELHDSYLRSSQFGDIAYDEIRSCRHYTEIDETDSIVIRTKDDGMFEFILNPKFKEVNHFRMMHSTLEKRVFPPRDNDE